MRNLILARHGNTFNPGDKVTFVGARNDLPLVESGIQQATLVGQSLLAKGICLDAIFCGPLKRTRQFAEIIRTILAFDRPPIVDERLNELDYGQWSGLTDTEVIEKFGQSDFDNWNKNGIWPKEAFAESDSEINSQIASFVMHLKCNYEACQNVLAISSNGKLRYFLRLIPGLWESASQANQLKVATGKICLFQFQSEFPQMKMPGWNLDPQDAARILTEQMANQISSPVT
jgi:broad specificity phosphatase PhoE